MTTQNITACEECGNPDCSPCFDRDDDGEYQDSVPSHWYCEEHARSAGYCLFCGQHEDSARDDPSGVCDECRDMAIRETTADDGYDDEYGDDYMAML